MYATSAGSSLQNNSACNRASPGATDFTSADGALQLADTITAYWQKRGFPGIKVAVKLIANPVPDVRRPPIHIITSNIGPNGYPPPN